MIYKYKTARILQIIIVISFLLFINSFAYCSLSGGTNYSFHCFSDDGQYAIVSHWVVEPEPYFMSIDVMRKGRKKPVETFTEKNLPDLKHVNEQCPACPELKIPKQIIKKYRCYDKGFFSKTSSDKQRKIIFQERKLEIAICKSEQSRWGSYRHKLQIQLKTKEKTKLLESMFFYALDCQTTQELQSFYGQSHVALDVVWSRSGKSFIILGNVFSVRSGAIGDFVPILIFSGI